MKKIVLATLSFAAVFGFMAAPSGVVLAQASDIKEGVTDVGGGDAPELGDQIKIVVNILLFVLGAIAVVMIVIGGIRYATSGGDQSAITSAKNTILYAVVGLVVAILAYAIVNFVLDAFITEA